VWLRRCTSQDTQRLSGGSQVVVAKRSDRQTPNTARLERSTSEAVADGRNSRKTVGARNTNTADGTDGQGPFRCCCCCVLVSNAFCFAFAQAG
jgi:hypothetical protein